jgi:hypothetical protein
MDRIDEMKAKIAHNEQLLRNLLQNATGSSAALHVI